MPSDLIVAESTYAVFSQRLSGPPAGQNILLAQSGFESCLLARIHGSAPDVAWVGVIERVGVPWPW